MNRESALIWPFDVLPTDKQTDQHRLEISFLQTAHEQGYISYTFGAGDYGAMTNDGKNGEIIRRGRNRWIVVLGIDGHTHQTSTHDTFSSASVVVLNWLKSKAGDDEEMPQ